jgi:hypothetical protein
MRSLARLLLLVVVGLVLCFGVSHTVASSESSEGRNAASWLLQEVRRAEALHNCSRIIARAQQTKHTVISDLLAKKLTAREAVEQFAAEDESLAKESSGLPMPYCGPRTEEEVRKQLLGWVKNELVDNPQQAEEVIRQVEEELTETSADTQ